MKLDELNGKVNVAIITIKQEEFESVLEFFPHQIPKKGRRYYFFSQLEDNNGHLIQVAITRCNEQGTGEAQGLANDIIFDLNPDWILVVGIAGGVPATEFTLGDVVLSTRIYDFNLRAAIEGQSIEYSVGGGPGKKDVTNLVTALPGLKSTLAGWNELEVIKIPRPVIRLPIKEDLLYGDPRWQKKVRNSLEYHFDEPKHNRPPLVTSGPIASSDTLVKDLTTGQKLNNLPPGNKIEMLEVRH